MAKVTPDMLAKLGAMQRKEEQINEGYDRSVPGLLKRDLARYSEEEIHRAKQTLLALWGENEESFQSEKAPQREDVLYWMNRKIRERQLLAEDTLAQDEAVREALNTLYAFDAIQELMDNPRVTDIRIISDLGILYKMNGRIDDYEKVMSFEEVIRFINRQVVGLGKTFDLSNPQLDARLKDGSRLHVRGGSAGYEKHTPTPWGERYQNPQAIIVNIRKGLGTSVLTLEDLLSSGMMDHRLYGFLQFMIQAGFSCLVSGGTGSGKTTLLQALTANIRENQDVFIVEEEPEIRTLIQKAMRVFRYWNTPANPNGKGAIGEFGNLMALLRSNADNVIFGEVRTPVAAYWGLQVAMTITYLYLATVHGISVTSAVRRMIDLASGSQEATSLHSVASSFSESIRFVIAARKIVTKAREETRRIAEVGMVLPEYQRSQGVQFYRLFKWNPMDDTWQFYGLPEWLQEEAFARNVSIPKELEADFAAPLVRVEF